MALIPDLRDFRRIVFFTGAGMSAESGIHTYRGAGGVWRHYDYQRYACERAFLLDPRGVWEFHNYRRQLVMACEPHLGHTLLAKYAEVHPHVTIITQNIDGMHQRSGCRRVIELHGSLWRVRHPPSGETITTYDIPFAALRPDGTWWRPDIVWFEDCLKDHTIEQALSAIDQCDLLISIGTSAVVYPAAQMPFSAKKAGATLIEINPEPTELSDAYDLCIRDKASAAIEKLCRPS
jgi:NAD-dependent deacetylase